MPDVIYLDNNATTRPAREAVDAMLPLLNDQYGNPSSLHRAGQMARNAMDHARHQVAKSIGCDDRELQFTSGGTESINTIVRGLMAMRSPRNTVITSTVEHSATREVCGQLAKEGCNWKQIAVNTHGALDLISLRKAVESENAALVNIMWANNETGVLFPVGEIAAACKEHRVPFHCDGTQALGKIAVDVHAVGIDAMSFSGHKFHAPKGVGGLYARRGLRYRPFVVGGPQEHDKRGGTENVPGIVAMGAAAELASNSLTEMSRVAALRDRFEQTILRTIPDSFVNGEATQRVPNTSNIGFARLEAEAILLLLSENGVCASAGSACSSGSLEPSHVIQAMGIDPAIGHGAIRFSLSKYTTDAEIDRALEIIRGVIARLRRITA